jgi:tetratricopeptide (TPR) repeat protein
MSGTIVRVWTLAVLWAAVGCITVPEVDPVEEVLAKARELHADGRVEQSDQVLERLPAAAEHPDLALRLFDYYAKLGRYQKALGVADVVLERDAASEEALRRRVLALRHLRREREALEGQWCLWALRPYDPVVHYELGELQAHVGAAGAEESFDLARRLAPHWWKPWVAQATLQVQNKEPAAAGELLEEYLREHGDQPDVLAHLALVREQEDRPQDARILYERSLKLDPRNVQALCNAALLAEKTGEKERAMKLWQRALNAIPREDLTRRRAIQKKLTEE